MQKCVVCHDGKRASASCETCHDEDVGTPSASPGRLANVELTNASHPGACYACHNDEPCTACHGVTMPHPSDWKDMHIRDGFARKEICWRCHYEPGKPFLPSDKSCAPCHGLKGSMHGPNWLKEHGPQATGEADGHHVRCISCHSWRCDRCHDTSFNDRYAPRQPRHVEYGPNDLLPEPCANCHGDTLDGNIRVE
jgi:hypothetical protein